MPYKNAAAQAEYQRNWRAARRHEFMKDKSCVRCGSCANLELDHIDPRQKIGHGIWSWAEKRRLEELDKCQVLCRDCHMDKTLAMRRKAKHGSGQMYQAHKCRCEPCREWKRLSDQKYRGKKSQ